MFDAQSYQPHPDETFKLEIDHQMRIDPVSRILSTADGSQPLLTLKIVSSLRGTVAELKVPTAFLPEDRGLHVGRFLDQYDHLQPMEIPKQNCWILRVYTRFSRKPTLVESERKIS